MRRVGWQAVALLSLLACSGRVMPGSGVVLLLDTDMAVPANINEVALYVEKVDGGNRRTVLAQRARPIYDAETDSYSVNFAARLNLQADTESAQAGLVRTRFVGFTADGNVVAMREARTKLPRSGVKRLPLPLLFVNSGRVIDTEAGVVAPGANSLDLSVVEEDDRQNPFTRWRHPECGDEETLGDDGKCQSIDVDVDSLPDFNPDEQIACVDAQACFSGDEGVRSLVPNEACQVHVPPADGNNISVAVRTQVGYDAGGRIVQPVASNLYTFDGQSRLLTLNEPLCARVRAGSNEIYVSVKCAPIPAAAPVCGPWRADSPPLDPGQGKYLGDASTPPPPPDGESPSDGGVEDDADAAVTPPGYHERDYTVDVGATLPELVSFAAFSPASAGPAGSSTQSAFLLTTYDDVFRVQVLSFDANRVLTEASDEPEVPETGRLQWGRNGELYLLYSPYSDAVVPRQLVRGGQLVPLVYNTPGGERWDIIDNDLSLGELSSKVVGVEMTVDPDSYDIIYTARPVNEQQPERFEFSDASVSGPRDYDAGSALGRGGLVGADFWLPATRVGGFLRLSAGNDGPALTLVPAMSPPDFVPETLLPLGGGLAVTVGKLGYYNSAIYETSFDNNGVPTFGREVRGLTGEDEFDQAYAGGGHFCARQVYGRSLVDALVCGYVEQGEVVTVDIPVPGPVHLYGDADYLYVASACADPSEPTKLNIKLRALPWDSSLYNLLPDTLEGLACPD